LMDQTSLVEKLKDIDIVMWVGGPRDRNIEQWYITYMIYDVWKLTNSFFPPVALLDMAASPLSITSLRQSRKHKSNYSFPLI
jgi:hypothetical protein